MYVCIVIFVILILYLTTARVSLSGATTLTSPYCRTGSFLAFIRVWNTFRWLYSAVRWAAMFSHQKLGLTGSHVSWVLENPEKHLRINNKIYKTMTLSTALRGYGVLEDRESTAAVLVLFRSYFDNIESYFYKNTIYVSENSNEFLRIIQLLCMISLGIY